MARLEIVDGKIQLVDLDTGEPPCSTDTTPVKIDSVSVSQLNEFERCPRRWFFRKVRRVFVPEGNKKAAMMGTEIHRLIENWFKTGAIPQGHPHEAKARAAVAHLPAPGTPGIEVEKWFRIEDEDLPRFVGVIDWVQVNED